jgi:predicted DNA-binding transcriptional regulator AlpA
MRDNPSLLDWAGPRWQVLRAAAMLTARELCNIIGISLGWVYKRTKKGAIEALPVIRLGSVESVSILIRFPSICWLARSIARCYAGPDRGNCPSQRKGGNHKLTRKQFQTGSVRLREDRGAA